MNDILPAVVSSDIQVKTTRERVDIAVGSRMQKVLVREMFAVVFRSNDVDTDLFSLYIYSTLMVKAISMVQSYSFTMMDGGRFSMTMETRRALRLPN